MQFTPVFTKVFDDCTYHFFLEDSSQLQGWNIDPKVSLISLTDEFGGACGKDISCIRCPFNEFGDCSDPAVVAAKVPELAELYPEYFI